MDQNVPIIGGGITNRPPLPDDLARYITPDHLVQALSDLTRTHYAELSRQAAMASSDPAAIEREAVREVGTHIRDRGTVGFKSLPNTRRFFTAACLARKELGLPVWPSYEDWARANGIQL